MTLSGTDVRQLTSASLEVRESLYSPDGSQIVCTGTVGARTDVYVLDLGGGLSSGVPFSVTAGLANGGSQPRYSPDSSRIVFSEGGTGGGIWTVNPDGTGLFLVTTDLATNRSPRFSPDGTKICYVSDRSGDDDVYVIRVDGTGEVRLTTDPARDRDPFFNADSTGVFFTSRRVGLGDLFHVNLQGAGLVNLTQSPSTDYGFSLLAGGQQLLFSSDGQNCEIFVMNVDGSGRTNLTNSPADDLAAVAR